MNVLACIDRSPYADSVCAYAGWVAERVGGAVTLLQVIEDQGRGMAAADRSGVLGIDAADQALHEVADREGPRSREAARVGREALDHARREIERRNPTVAVSTHLAHGRFDEVAPPLLRADDLVVIGRQGEGHAGRSGAPGGAVERLVRSGHHATLVVPMAFAPVRKALMAYDARPGADAAVALLATSGLARELAVHVVRVGDPDAAAEARLRAAGERLAAAGAAATTATASGRPREVLAGAVAAGGVDLVVMGANGHSRLHALVVGSTTTALLAQGSVPVLVAG